MKAVIYSGTRQKGDEANEDSKTLKLSRLYAERLEEHDCSVKILRLADIDLPNTGGKKKKAMLEAAFEADLVVFATPIFWSNHSSLIQRLIEYFDDQNTKDMADEDGKFASRTSFAGKVFACLIVGKEDGTQDVMGGLLNFASWLGFHIAPFAGVTWTNTPMWEVKEMIEVSSKHAVGLARLLGGPELYAKQWDESEHPRNAGKFATKQGSKAGNVTLELSPVIPGSSDVTFKDGQVVEGTIGDFEVTTSERGLIEKLSQKTIEQLESALSSSDISDVMKMAGISSIHIVPRNYASKKGGPKNWTAASNRNQLVIHPHTAAEIEKSTIPERRDGGFPRVVAHESGHGMWNLSSDQKKDDFAAGLKNHPDLVDHISRIVNVKAIPGAFEKNESRIVTESFAELSAMRIYDKQRYDNLPTDVRKPIESILEQQRAFADRFHYSAADPGHEDSDRTKLKDENGPGDVVRMVDPNGNGTSGPPGTLLNPSRKDYSSFSDGARQLPKAYDPPQQREIDFDKRTSSPIAAAKDPQKLETGVKIPDPQPLGTIAGGTIDPESYEASQNGELATALQKEFSRRSV